MRKIYSLVVRNYFLQVLLIGSLLLGNFSVFGQTTVFSQNFNSPGTTNSTSYTTSGTITAGWVVNRPGNAWGARISSNRLELTNDAGGTRANGWAYAYVDQTGAQFNTSVYNTRLDQNAGLVTWNFNMRQIRSDPSGFGSNSYGSAFILASSSTSKAGVGYAVVLGNSGATDPIRLVRFSSGLGSTTDMITSNTSGLTDFGTQYLSVRVTYNPSNNQWQLFVRNDGTSSFADPATGTLTSQGTVTNNTYTANTTLRYTGCHWNGSTAAGQTAFFDNISILVNASVSPTVTTDAPATSITTSSAASGGNVTAGGSASVTARGVVWGTSANPTVPSVNSTSNGTGTGTFSSSITGLTANTLYNYRAYATNTVGTSYGSNLTFTTLPNVPTTPTTNGTPGTNDFTASWTAPTGGTALTVSYEIEVYDNNTFSGSPVYTNTSVSGTTENVNSGLNQNSTYYYRVRSKTTAGVSGWENFISGVTTAASGTPIISLSRSSITGFEYILGAGPSGVETLNVSAISLSTTTGNIVVDATGTDYEISDNSSTGFVSGTLNLPYTNSELLSTPVYVRLAAGKSAGNYNSQSITFSGGGATTETLTVSGDVVILEPTVVTLNNVTNLSTTGATLEAEITAINGDQAVERGIEYSTTINFVNGTGTAVTVASGPYNTGTYTTSVSGLTPNTVYYYKGIAENNAGIGYGAQESFTTLPNNPTNAGASTPTIHGFTATWTAPAGNGSVNLDYEIEVHTNNTFTDLVGTYNQTTDAATNLVIYDATNIDSNTMYYYRVRSVNASGPNSAWVDYTTGITTARPSPDINIQINSVNIANGGSNSYGVVPNSTNTNRTVVIQNTGTGTLNINSINLNNKNGNSFSITTTPLPTSVAAGGSTSIVVACNPSSNGYYEATLTINTDNVAPDNVYDFTLNAASGTTVTLLSFPTGSQSSFGPSPLASSSTVANITLGGLTRGSGFTTSGTAAAGWGGNGLTATDLNSAISGNDFVTFTVEANCGYALNLIQIPAYNVRRSGSGPASMQWQYRINSGTYQNIGGTVSASSTSSSSPWNALPAISLSSITNLQNIKSGNTVTFRLVIWGGSGSTGTWYLQNTLALTGVLTSTPEVTLSSPTQVAANNAVANNTLNHLVSIFQMKVEDGLSTVNSVTFTPTGTATDAQDINNYKLYTNTTNTFTGATLRSTVSSFTIGNPITFGSLNLATNATGVACSTDLYFFITADVRGSAQDGRTFTAGIPTIDLTNSPIITSSISAGGQMEIVRISSISASVNQLPEFNSTGINEVSNVQSFEVAGSGLTNDITVTAPTDFEVSLNSTSGFGSSLTLLKNVDDEVSTTEIFVRFAPTGTTGQKTDDITIASSPLTSQLVEVDGLAVTSSPLEQPTNLLFTNVTSTAFTIDWTNPTNANTGDNTIAVVKSTTSVDTDPNDGTIYAANSVFATGDDIGNSNYVVFFGTGNSVTVTGLTSGVTYHVALYRSNGSTTEINYLETTPLIGNITTRSGLQINHIDSLVTINFDQTVNGVNEGRLDATGSTLSTTNATSGKLLSSAWSFLGSKTNVATFGVNQNVNQGSNQTSQPTAGAGLYVATLSSSPLNRGIGVQSTAGSNIGSATIKIQNNSGTTITNLRTSYKVYFTNPSDTRQMRAELYYSSDNSTYNKVANTEYSNPANSLSGFNYVIVNVDIATSIANGSFGYVRLTYDEPNTAIGSGNRPFIVFDDIKFVANPSEQDIEIDAITGTLLDYKNLTKSKLISNVTVSNDFIHNDEIDLGSNTLTIANNYTRNGGTFTNPDGSITVQGTGSVASLPTLDVNNFTVNKSGGVTVAEDVTVRGALTLTSGNLTIGSNNLTLRGSISGSGLIVADDNSSLIVGGNGATGVGTVTYSTTNKTLSRIRLERTGLTGTNPAVTVDNNLTLTDSLVLESGKLRLNNRNLTLGNSMVTSGGNANSYIITDGSSRVSKEIAAGENYAFPLGYNPYLPLEISVPAGQPDADWSVSVTEGITETDGTTAETTNGVLATWTVESSENVDRPVFTPTWTATAEGANMTTYRSEARVIMRQGTSGQWNKQITTQAPGVVGSDPFSVSSWGYDDFPANTLFQVGVSHNSDLVINPLPVELISFDAVKFEGNGLLTWTTAWEVDNLGFYIERSENGNDWNSIGFVNGNGTKNDISNYSFIDRNLGELSNGVAYYRLQQVDFNGATEYSPVRVLRFNETEVSSVAKIQVMYQSFEKAPLVQFTTPNQGNVSVSLYTTQGKLVGAINQSIQSGVNQLVMPTPLSKGLYLLQINDGTQTFLEKVRF